MLRRPVPPGLPCISGLLPGDTLEVRGLQVTIRDGWFLDFLKTHWFWLFQNVSKSKNSQFSYFLKP
jgi:hypothetical protein